MCSHIFPQSTKAYSPWPCPCAAEVPPSCPVTDNAMLPWSNWIVPSALGTKVKPASLHRPFDNPHDAENTARMGDKAKPSSVGAPTALLFEGGAGIIARCVGRTIFPIPRLAPFVGRWDTRFILAFSGAKHPAIVEAS